MRSRQNSVNLIPSSISAGRCISAGLLLALVSASPMTDPAFAENYTLTNRVKPTEAGINGLPAGKKLADLTSADTLNVTGGNAQLYFDSSADMNCNIIISGNARDSEKTGKFRLQNSSTVVNLNGMVTLAGDTAVGSHVWQSSQGKLYFNNQITGTGALLIAPSSASSVYLNNTGANKNNYTGNTQIGNSDMYNNSGVTNYGGSVYLLADEQIPDTVTAGASAVGNLVLMSWEDTRLRSKLDLNGHTETVNGLVSADTWSVVTSSADGGKLIVGANDTTSEYRGVLEGSMSLEKIGSGSLTLIAGNNGNTYTGGTVVSGGTLYLQGPNRSKSSVGTGDLVINAGARVEAQSHNVFAGGTADNMPHVIINGGTLKPYEYLHMRSLELHSGVVETHGSAGDGLDFNNRNGVITSTGTSSIASAMKNTSTLTINVQDGTLSLTGNVTNTGTNKTVKTGAGTLTTSAWISGHTEVQEGTLQITGGFGNGKRFNGEVTVAEGASLICATHDSLGYSDVNTKLHIYGLMDSTVGNETLNNTEIHMYGGTAAASGNGSYDILNTGVKYFSHALDGATAEAPTVSTISAATRLRTDGSFDITTDANSQLNLTGVISTNSGNAAVTKLGAGTLVLSTAHTFTGGMVIQEGEVVLSNKLNDGNRFASAVTVNEGATLVCKAQDSIGYGSGAGTFNLFGGTLFLDGYNETFQNKTVNLKGGVILSSGNEARNALGIFKNNTVFNVLAAEDAAADAPTVSYVRAPLNLRNTTDFNVTVEENAKLVVEKSLLRTNESTKPLVKKGAGTMVISGENTHQTPIQAAEGRLDFSGTLTSDLAIADGALFSPGDGIGTLTVNGAFSAADGARLVFEIGEETSDLLVLGNGSTLDIADDAILELLFTDADPSKTYTLIEAEGGLGEYADAAFWTDLLATAADTNWQLQVAGNTLQAVFGASDSVPEPATWALLVLGCAGLFFVRKKRVA
ncbi:MAG: autotransporter-associated beta strand repeat-containing protein [Thermoguttaceae bacterium]|nr:autotransporter-associated beta strand repeat-containing protein [Thermoguttaceae bacterium]